jgi:hypothetical protein
MRIFPASNDVPLLDAARAWVTKDADRMDTGAPAVVREESGAIGEVVGSLMPFDMDSPVAFSVAGISGAVGGTNDALAVEVAAADESERAVEVAREAALRMSQIEKDRIPCPRLCGATFSPGAGGLTIFNNGEVRKMWRWWDKNAQTRLASSAPTLTRDTTAKIPRTDGVDPGPPQFAIAVTRDCPRTLQDLVDMVTAAKEAQWGDQDESDMSSADDFRLLTSKFFDDDDGSDGSTISIEDDTTDLSESHRDMYESYFSDATRPLIAASPNPLGSSSDDNVGPSSYMLSPSVHLSRAYDDLAFNNQSDALAEGWKLGAAFFDVRLREEYMGVDTKPEVDDTLPRTRKTATSLPRYRFLVPPVDSSTASYDTNPLARAASDPAWHLKHYHANKNLPVSGLLHEDDIERGVHGGEYSVRPNMQESMVFLKKLFTQQQKDERLSVSHAAMFSPPDSPMCKFKFSFT